MRQLTGPRITIPNFPHQYSDRGMWRISPTMSETQTFISKVEVAERLGINRRHVHRWIADGRITVDEQGRILRAEFEAVFANVGISAAKNNPEETP